MGKRLGRIGIMALYAVENSGVRHLGAVLKQQGWDVDLIFFKQWFNNRVAQPSATEYQLLNDLISSRKYGLFGISFGSPYLQVARQLSRAVRAAHPALPQIWGGLHATLDPESCLEHADLLCVGEGEEVLLEVVSAMECGKSLEGISNLWGRRPDGSWFRNPVRGLSRDLDQLPFRDLGGQDKFFIEHDKLSVGDPELYNREFRIHASRGCLFRCAYCYNSSLSEVYGGAGNYQRLRSVSNVLEEIKQARRIMPNIRRIKFDDDTFFFPRQWLDEFCQRYPGEIGLPFFILLNPQVVNEDVLRSLRDAGLEHVQVGIQSASAEEAAEVFGRTSTNADVMAFARLNQRLGLQVTYDIILDDPLATPGDKDQLVRFLLELPGPYRLFLYSLTLFPKSAVARDFIRLGIAEPEDVEGQATKSFHQFRVSLDYPRSKEDTFYLALLVLMTKRFLPRSLIVRCWKSRFFRENPGVLLELAEAANLVMMAEIGLRWGLKGELSLFKIREYGSVKRMITQ